LNPKPLKALTGAAKDGRGRNGPYTLDPKTLTLNPKPYTIDPKL